MQKIKFDINVMKFITLFDTVTRSKVKDCIVEDSRIIFIVQENEIGKAIGKGGANIKKLEKMLNRKIKIVEFNPQLLQFVQNVVYPLKIKEIAEEEGVVTITPPDTKTRGMLIGPAAQNLRNHEQIVQRYFDIKEIKVV